MYTRPAPDMLWEGIWDHVCEGGHFPIGAAAGRGADVVDLWSPAGVVGEDGGEVEEVCFEKLCEEAACGVGICCRTGHAVAAGAIVCESRCEGCGVSWDGL